ncbi:hypothetical protein, partial [Salmonella enterica]|uniref:hypothetical protein n=1 Tax=Salmonella enterica TaxID=28901 RepID=UPI003D296980
PCDDARALRAARTAALDAREALGQLARGAELELARRAILLSVPAALEDPARAAEPLAVAVGFARALLGEAPRGPYR